MNILGTEYSIQYKELKDEGIDGYTDYTSKEIVLRSDNENNLGDFGSMMKKQLRHEIIHAFLAESGLQGNFEHFTKFGHEETMVDWFAIQFPKIQKAYEQTGAL